MGKKTSAGSNPRSSTEKKVKKERVKPTRLSPEEKADKYGKSRALNYKIDFSTKSEKQQLLYDTIDEKQITLIKGPAGCGKSYVTLNKALTLLKDPNNNFNKLIVLTPIVPITDLGALPGTLSEKIFSATLADRSTIIKILDHNGNNGKEVLTKLEESGIIEFDCIAFWRGRSIENAIVCVSEASNLLPRDLKSAITRIEGSKYIISGDPEQCDLPTLRNGKKQIDGLTVAFKKLEDIEEIGKVIFTDEDEIVRDPIIRKILNAWKDNEID